MATDLGAGVEHPALGLPVLRPGRDQAPGHDPQLPGRALLAGCRRRVAQRAVHHRPDRLGRRDVEVRLGPQPVGGVDGVELVGEIVIGPDRHIPPAHASSIGAASDSGPTGARRGGHSIRLRQTGAVPTSSDAATGWAAPAQLSRSMPPWCCPGRSRSPTGCWCSPRSRTRRPGCARRCEPATPCSWPTRCARSGARSATTDEDWIVTPAALRGGTVDCGLAGTIMRFVPPLAALAVGEVTFDGDAYARERPMAVLIDGLRQAGVEVADGGTGRLPFTVHGTRQGPGRDDPPRRLGLLAVRVRAAAQRAPATTRARDRAHRRPGRALPAPPRHDPRAAAGGRGGGRVPRPGRLAGRAGPGRRRRPHRRARPLQRRPVPRRGAGHRRHRARARLAGPHHPARRRHR